MAESGQAKSKLSFKWQFSLKDKSFDCDPLLPGFLGFPNKKKISIAQLFSRIDTRQASEITRAFKNVLETQESFTAFVIINIPEHRYLVELSISPLEETKNVVEGELTYVQAFPVTLQENSFLRKVFNNAENGRMMATSNHIIVMANKTFCREIGYEEHELIGKSAKIMKSGQYAPEFYKNLWNTVDTAKIWRGELLTRSKANEVYAREVQIQRFEIDDKSHFYFVNSVKLDVPSALINSENAADGHHSNLPDKAKFTKELQSCYKNISSEETIVLVTFSLTWLQKVSDFTACWLISQRFQISKLEGTIGLIRGGMYSIFWVEEKNPDKIDAKLRQLLKVFSHGFDDSDYDLFSTANAGVSILAVDAKNSSQLISHSIQTLIANQAKEFSSLYYFDPRLAKRFDRHQILAKLLREALNEGSVEVYYQPIVGIPTMEIREFEALFRIKLETEIDYDTQELIRLAEAYNWIDEIDSIVTKIALDALPKIQKHFNNDKIAVAVNRSLANDRVAHCCLEDTIALLLASGKDLTNVTIELTESAIFENFDQQKQWVEKLQSHGVKIAIDDFGTGYSSFAYLNNLSVDFIKIDRSFVTNLTYDSNEYSMIKMLCKLAHKMGAEVVAEGVETEEEFTLLSRAKVDMLQGYIFSKAISLKELLSTPFVPYPAELANCVYYKQKATLGDICIEEFQTIDADDRLGTVKELLEEQKQRFFIILEHKKCLGILYSADHYSSVSPYVGTKGEQKRDLITLERRVHQVMKKEFMSLDVSSDISLAEEHFATAPYSVIIVTNSLHHCIGVTTVQALLSYQKEQRNKLITG